MAREPQLTTPFGRLAWDLYQEEILSRMGEMEGPMAGPMQFFLGSMEEEVVEVAESIDQDPELQAKIIDRIEQALAEVKSSQSEGATDATSPNPV